MPRRSARGAKEEDAECQEDGLVEDEDDDEEDEEYTPDQEEEKEEEDEVALEAEVVEEEASNIHNSKGFDKAAAAKEGKEEEDADEADQDADDADEGMSLGELMTQAGSSTKEEEVPSEGQMVTDKDGKEVSSAANLICFAYLFFVGFSYLSMACR